MPELIWFLVGCTFTLIVALALLPRRRNSENEPPETEPEPPPAPRRYVLADNRNLETLTHGLGGELASLATSVEGHAQRLCEALEQPALARQRSERLWESVRRLRFLTEKMQSFASVAQLESRPTRIRPILQALVHEIEDYAGASLQVSLSTAPSLPMALADADALRLALLFLIEAVLTLEPNTPNLTISAQTELDEDMDAEVLVELEAEAEDSSAPDPEGDIRFSYVAARNILEAQGAWISLMHRPGLSVVASVSLKATTTPVLEPALSPVETPVEIPRRVEPHAFGGVLVLDRNPGIREMLTRELERFGRNVIACDEGKAARTLYNATPERFELLILEQDARRLSGVELATQALSERADLRVVLLTPSHAVDRVQQLVTDARCQCIPKPFGVMELRSVLGAFLGAAPEPERPHPDSAGKAAT